VQVAMAAVIACAANKPQASTTRPTYRTSGGASDAARGR
jgi:hypothetical protein